MSAISKRVKMVHSSSSINGIQSIKSKLFQWIFYRIGFKATSFLGNVNTHHTESLNKSLEAAIVRDYVAFESIIYKASGRTLAPENCKHCKIF
jgi:hypothetical protein